MTDSPPSQRGAGGLGRVALLGSIFQMGGRGLRGLVGVGTVAILSRFLTPAEFGAFALISVIVAFAQIFADFGLRSALVRKTDVSDIEMNSVFWISIASGAALTTMVWLGADTLARLFEAPALVPQIQLVSLVFLLSAPRSIPLTTLERSFRFRQIATIEVAGAVAGAATAVAFAIAGARIGALVAQQLVMVILTTVLTIGYARWWPRMSFSWAAVKPLTAYGNYLTLSTAVQFLGSNIDKPLVGTRLSPTDLGYMTMGGQIVMSPIRIVTQNIRRVTFPIMSTFQQDNVRIALGHQATLHAVYLVLAPVCLGLSALSGPLARVLLGPGWEPVGPVIGAAALTVLVGSIGDMNSGVFSSKGRSRFLFGWSLFSLAGNVALLMLALPYGLMAIVWGRVGLATLFIAIQSIFLGRVLEVSAGHLLARIWRPLGAAIGMAIVVSGCDQLLAGMGQGALVRVGIGVPLGALVYAGLILLVDREQAMGLAKRILKIRSA